MIWVDWLIKRLLDMDLKYKDITEKVIGAGMKVHSTLGNGFQEVIYQRALALQMRANEIAFRNFGSVSLDFKRLINPKFNAANYSSSSKSGLSPQIIVQTP